MHSDVSRRWIWCNSSQTALRLQSWCSILQPNCLTAGRPNLTRLIVFTHSPSYFLKIHFNIILPSTHQSSQWSFTQFFPLHSTCTPLLRHLCLMTRPSHSSWFDHPKNTLKSNSIRWGLRWWSPCCITSSSHPSPHSSSVQVSSSTPYDRTRSACSFLNVAAQVSHPHKTGKLVVPYIIKSISFDSKRGYRRFYLKVEAFLEFNMLSVSSRMIRVAWSLYNGPVSSFDYVVSK